MQLDGFERRIEGLGVYGVKISQHGEVIAERLWSDDCRRNVFSASKSFTSVAVGMAQKEGLLRLDERLTDVFADELPEEVSENLRRATVRDLLTMCLGQGEPALTREQRGLYPDRDWVRFSLAQPFVNEPGKRFLYNNVGPYLAGVLVQRRAGCTLRDYLTPRLFEPLGIRSPEWDADPMGNTFGAGGLHLTLSELHRFGLLCLNGGRWEGRQLVPAEWMAQCGVRQGAGMYSYLFWLGAHDSFRADGMLCQWSIIYPKQDAVVTLTANCTNGMALSRAVDKELWTQLAKAE